MLIRGASSMVGRLNTGGISEREPQMVKINEDTDNQAN